MNISLELAELEEMLQAEEDFNAIFQKFMSLVDSPKFMGLGKQKKNKLMETVVKKVLDELGLDFLGIRVTYIRKFRFYHGSFITTGLPGAIFYYEDIKMGLITVSTDYKGQTSYFRFTGTEVMPGGFTADTSSETTH